jgi:hypothetical protein
MYCLYIWVENSNVSRETIVKMAKLFYTLLLFTVVSCQSQKLISKIENGDLLFVETNYKNLSGAISRVTENRNNLISYDHIILIEKNKNRLKAYHSSTENGSEKLDLNILIQRYHKQKRKLALYRIIDNQCGNTAINNAEKLLGKPYNDLYILNDNSYYCSDFIERVYRDCNLFSQDKMTFKNPNTGKTDEYWLEYYKERQTNVPEGQLGTNPNAMSKSDKIKLIFTE